MVDRLLCTVMDKSSLKTFDEWIVGRLEADQFIDCSNQAGR